MKSQKVLSNIFYCLIFCYQAAYYPYGILDVKSYKEKQLLSYNADLKTNYT